MEAIALLGPWRPQREYQDFIESKLSHLDRQDLPKLQLYENSIAKLYILNLDQARDLFKPLYPTIGRPALYQPEIIRALILMADLNIDGIPALVKRLRGDPFLAAICGFDDTSHVPGVGTFYDFINRLWGESPDRIRARKMMQRPISRIPKKKPQDGEKLPPQNPGIVKRIVDRIIEGRHFPKPPEHILQRLLARCCVDESAKMGLIGDTQNLSISGDGTCVSSYAKSSGIKTCDCREKGVHHCTCPRRYSDPDARIGWDSYRKQWFFGYSMYVLTASDSPYDLPLLLRFAEAPRHDSVISPMALNEFTQIYPDFKIGEFIGDSAHDSYDIYRLIYHLNASPVIDLNPRNRNLQYPGPINLNHLGIPICPGGFEMVPWGYCRSRDRVKWRCPHVLGRCRCPLDNPCSPSPYGRTIYTRPKWDIRIFTPIPRGTLIWDNTYDKRTSVERTNKRIKVDYGLDRIRFLSKKQAFLRATLHAMNMHLDAQIQHKHDELEALFSNYMPRAA